MIFERIAQLIDYAEEKGLIESCDRIWAQNRLIDELGLDGYEDVEHEKAELEDILKEIDDYAVQNGIIETDSVVFRDLFDARIMGLLTPAPHEVIAEFNEKS